MTTNETAKAMDAARTKLTRIVMENLMRRGKIPAVDLSKCFLEKPKMPIVDAGK